MTESRKLRASCLMIKEELEIMDQGGGSGGIVLAIGNNSQSENVIRRQFVHVITLFPCIPR